MKEERKHNYIVGYLGENQCIYGNAGALKNKDWIDPMTLFQAKQYVKKINKKWSLKGKDAMKVFKLIELPYE